MNPLKHCGRIISYHATYFPDFGDTIADLATFIFGLQHTSTMNNDPINCPMPLARKYTTVTEFIYHRFNLHNMCISHVHTNTAITKSQLVASHPIDEASFGGATKYEQIYNIHHLNDNKSVIADTGVHVLSGNHPPSCSPNHNNVGCTFGIEYKL